MKKSTKIQGIIICLFFVFLLVFASGCKKIEYTLNVNISPVGTGTVELSPNGEKFQEGTKVTLTPKPGSEYTFLGWSGPDSSSVINNKIVMSKNIDITAKFDLNSYSISVSVNPANSGTITGAGSYKSGLTVTLIATPATGYEFKNWTENGTIVSQETPYSFTASNNRTLVANFSLISYSISASINPANSGTVSGAGSYNFGQTASLTATPATGYIFSKWTENGVQVSTNKTYSFTVNSNRTLIANFELETMIRLQTGGGLNSGASIFFVALSKNVNYFILTVDELFDYNKYEADWYIDGGVIPFTTNYKQFNLATGVYYLLLSGSGTVSVTTITVSSGHQTFLVHASNGMIYIDNSQSLKSSGVEEESRKTVTYKR